MARRGMGIALWGLLLAAAMVGVVRTAQAPAPRAEAVILPAPRATGSTSVEEALGRRRSVREIRDAELPLASLAQVLWAAQGTRADGHRTAPSAGALYPLEVYVLAGRVAGVAPGVYRYRTAAHRLDPVASGDRRRDAAAAALGQAWLARAPVVLVIAAEERRTEVKYGSRATRYVDVEAGAVAQNVALQAVALGLGTTVVGAFDDRRVAEVAGLRPGERPVVILPLGVPDAP